MTRHSDGTVEETPERLAGYEFAKQRLVADSAQTARPIPDPWPDVPFDPQIADPPSSLRDGVPMSASRVCDACAAKVARGEMVVCGCVLSGPKVTC